MNGLRRKEKYFVAGAAFFGLLGIAAALFELDSEILLMGLRLLSYGCVLMSAACVILAIKPMGQEINLKNFDQPLVEKNKLPAPPAMPAGMQLQEACMGSLRGALRAVKQFAPGFQLPLFQWELERCDLALTDILKCCEAGADVCMTAEFATQYLPSAMQYVSACAAERCPENCGKTLAELACACEKQLDAVQAGQFVNFKAEYTAMRKALLDADFRWGI